ncbi:ANTAR domain-containing protein [Actinomycetospora lemnae]|uniref:ANTAR domain-containing protein n=1 Tax=Actinomycetospora lemnae TaxID=3019891 RepID=A0ABT5T1T7_9PSEU|nr:ANTAR domain-containing protein [Actinomycetospora sp. DW7H6]MDD7969071.1 ANTAR domain-containing protein [Actinomycetospora sp. DW7H6]
MEVVESLLPILRRAAGDLMRQRSIRDLEKTLAGIVHAAVDTVPGADAGGLSITEDGRVTARTPTSGSVTKLDQLQSDLHEGPCITALEDPSEDGLVLADDLAGADAARWPDFAPHAVEAGYRSVLSTRLCTDGRGMRAALNLYGGRPHVFDANARLTAGLFGAQAAILLYGSQHATNLMRAVDSRDVIGQAKGILMERFDVDEDDAFQMLVRSSQDTNMKLVDVAQWLRRETAERRRMARDADAG